MKRHEILALGAAALFAVSATTWALASTRPAADLPPAPGPSTAVPSTDAPKTSSSTSSSTTADKTTDTGTTQVEDVTTEPANEDETSVAPLPEPTSTWTPQAPGTSVPEQPTYDPVAPPLDPDLPSSPQEPDDSEASDHEPTDSGTSDSGTSDGSTSPANGTDPGPSSEPADPSSSTSDPDLLDPLPSDTEGDS